MNEQLAKLFGPNFKLKDIEISQRNNDLGIFSSTLMENSKIFRHLKNELDLYYKEKSRPQKFQTLHPEKSIAWKEHFYLNLQALLYEVTYTSDMQIKTYLLEKVYKWYAEKSQRAIQVPRPAPLAQLKEEIQYPLILQNIESTLLPKKPQILPKIPKPLNLEQEIASTFQSNPSNDNFFTATAPARTARSRRLFQPFPKSQGDPIIIDFRASSVGNSPETLRSTNYTDRESMNRTITNTKDGYECRVPMIRREQLKEIGLIKKRLATKHMSLPFKVLESGLVFSDFTQEVFPPMKLPRGGELLIKDTWPKAESKKKKKKAKKKTN